MNNLRSPFKFLDPYTSKDQDSFFGREEEEATLYEMLKSNRLVLVYGQSGTGKTSLVQCGLARRFDITDWYPMLIRRKENINDNLRQALVIAAQGLESNDAVELIEETYLNRLRPVYLIFDQLEELLIIGKPEEQQAFINTIAQILAANLPCRILFVLREEYIAYLYGFEKVIPTLFDRRLRVEPMKRSNIENVILKSSAQFNITFEKPEYNVGQIIDNLSAGRAGIQLPYLQVYLDMLWREDYKNTYPKGTNDPIPPLEFTTQGIADFGKIDDVLEQFLNEQTIEIQSDVKKQFPKAEDDLIRQLLDEFVTQEGTKRPIRYRMEGDTIYIEQSEVRLLNQLDPALRSYCLRRLEQSRLLTAREDTYELAHDTLAALIDQNRSEEQRRRNEAYNIVKNGYSVHQRTGEYLSRRQLLIVEEYLDETLPQKDDVLRQFVIDSSTDVKQKENRRVRNSYMIAAVGIALALLAFSQSIIARNQTKIAEQRLGSLQRLEQQRLYEESEKIKPTIELILDKAKILMNKKYHKESESLLKDAQENLDNYPKNTNLDFLRSRAKQRYQELDSLRKNNVAQ